MFAYPLTARLIAGGETRCAAWASNHWPILITYVCIRCIMHTCRHALSFTEIASDMHRIHAVREEPTLLAVLTLMFIGTSRSGYLGDRNTSVLSRDTSMALLPPTSKKSYNKQPSSTIQALHLAKAV